jgi:hypothetical protein
MDIKTTTTTSIADENTVNGIESSTLENRSTADSAAAEMRLALAGSRLSSRAGFVHQRGHVRHQRLRFRDQWRDHQPAKPTNGEQQREVDDNDRDTAPYPPLQPRDDRRQRLGDDDRDQDQRNRLGQQPEQDQHANRQRQGGGDDSGTPPPDDGLCRRS